MSFLNTTDLPLDPKDGDLIDLQVHLRNNYENLENEFAKFRRYALIAKKQAENIIKTKIDSEPVILQESIHEASAVSCTIGQIVADAKSYLVIYSVLYFCPKRPKFSDPDRKRFTELKTIPQQNLLDHMSKLESKIDTRVTIYQSVLKAQTLKFKGGEI